MMEMLGDKARAELAGGLGLVIVHCRRGCARGEAVRGSRDECGKELKGLDEVMPGAGSSWQGDGVCGTSQTGFVPV